MVDIQVVDGALWTQGGGKAADDDSSTLTLSLLAILGPRGVTIIAIILCASAIIIVLFLIAAVCLVRRRRNRYHKADRGGPPACNGDKYNCRVEALKAIKESSNAEVDNQRSLIQTFESSPRTPTSRVVLLAGSGDSTTGNGRLVAARWDGSVGQPSCQRQLRPVVNAPAPDVVVRASASGADRTLSTFGKTLPPPSLAKRTLSNSDVTTATPDVKV